MGKKTAEDTLQTAKLLMDHGLRDLINEADSLGNTPLHVLIARYALEERKLAHSNSKSYGYHDDHQVFKNIYIYVPDDTDFVIITQSNKVIFFV